MSSTVIQSAAPSAALESEGSSLDSSLKRRLQRTTRRHRLRAFALTLPLLTFILLFFALPLVDMMARSFYDPRIADALPRTMAVLEDWEFEGLPPEAAYAAVARELLERQEDGSLGSLALQLNHEIAGARTILLRTAKGLEDTPLPAEGSSYRDLLTSIHPQWGEQDFWSTLKIMGDSFTLRHYLAAFDQRYDASGDIVARPDYEQVHVMLFGRTLWASALIVVLTLLLGFPIAYHIANSPPKVGNLLLILVLLPFWTALLVRTAAWIVLLQQQGVLNDLLVTVGLVADDARLRMMHNMIGTIVAMTHIMLPFMVLPLYSVMKSIPPVHMRAAASLGAPPFLAFIRVYLPQTKPGIAAGCILVFILCIGYYITPALVGGRTGQFISSFVAYHIQQSLNWGLAAALSGVILVTVLLLYLLYSRLFGGDSIRLG